MDDLISRKAAMKSVEEYVRLRGMPPPEYATNVIKRLPSVPAVPLEPLCKWLSLNYGAPCNCADSCVADICETDGAGKCYGMGKPDEECWKYLLTKTFMNKKED